jgi:uncharacterized membrane protein
MRSLVLADRFGRFGPHTGWFWLPRILFLLLIAGLAAALIITLFRPRRALSAPSSPTPPVPGSYAAPPRHDDALTVLRTRYARGEISRDDYFRMAHDLGAPVGATPPPTETTSPPDNPDVTSI